jgi:chromosome segregation ATPase
VKEIILSKGFELIPGISVQRSDFAVRHSEFLLNGFFKIFTTGKDLTKHWAEVQEEVKENLELHAEILNHYNTYLIFLLPTEELPTNRELQPIISDEYICRKLIIPIEGKNIQKCLARLPFFPFEIPELPKEEISKNVIKALVDSDFPYELISDLAGRVSKRTILQKLKDSLYKHEMLKLQKVNKISLPVDHPAYPIRIKNISIRNFRGIGKKLDLDIDADIVIIYGPNGTGKTSIIDAIEWTITGEVERLWGKNYDKPVNANESLVNLFSKEQLAETQVEFSKNGVSILEKRYVDLFKSRRSYAKINNRRANDKTMIRKIVGMQVPQEDVRRLRRIFLRSHFLGQNTILEFITQKPEIRYDAFSRMVGTQDYILFNEKVNSVIKVSERELETRLKEKNEFSEEIKNISVQINRKKRTLKEIKRGIKEELSTQLLIEDMQILLQKLIIKVPKFLFQRKKGLPEIEKLDKMIEIISPYPPRSSKKINTLSNLIVEAKSQETRVQEIEKVMSNMNEFTRKTKELQKLYSSKEPILKIFQNELKKYLRQKENYDKQIVNTKWLV